MMYYFALVAKNATNTKNNQIIGWSAIESDNPPVCDTALDMKAVLLTEMTPDEWEQLTRGKRGQVALQKGKLIPFQYTQPPLPLKAQAESTMTQVQQQAALAFAMGQSFGPKMRQYVQQLQAIINGSDTATTTLPQKPEDITR